jgi:hypothetical protein
VKELAPRDDLAIPIHPLVPRQSGTVKVKGSDGDAFLLRNMVVGEKLTDFEDPTMSIGAVKPWDIEFETVTIRRVWRWWLIRTGDGRWSFVHAKRDLFKASGDESKLLSEFINTIRTCHGGGSSSMISTK